ncbi:LysR family transcriptional regulator [Usitatibacter palustris]|uniref:HTH-type transcriptional regulator MetR n=1 Tax=Usitatibacter palustris TaxID=2732487 RepID=A0A6M4H8G3_9PROT|nr:LysR family transcriptional regulator [Usitatibacter palustris]QJR15871.1 HTH-type transcriptional regulator MetR [Usitatibacter palustris]
MIEIRHLRTLAALSETGNVSRAAARVHLTQSAVSHQLRALEAHLGAPIVERKGAGIALTAAGRRLVELGREVLEQVRSAERDIANLAAPQSGSLRIALECHTCFDWLMPVMDAYRPAWPAVELDLVSGFHPDPLRLLDSGGADLVICSEKRRTRGVTYFPLFRFEILGVLAHDHPLARRRLLKAADFAGETLITYPVPEERIDVIRQVLKPERVKYSRRTAELTIGILQLVASRRGVAALPSWGLANYLAHDYVVARRIGAGGLWSDLYAATTAAAGKRPYVRDFVATAKARCFATLKGLVALG